MSKKFENFFLWKFLSIITVSNDNMSRWRVESNWSMKETTSKIRFWNDTLVRKDIDSLKNLNWSTTKSIERLNSESFTFILLFSSSSSLLTIVTLSVIELSVFYDKFFVLRFVRVDYDRNSILRSFMSDVINSKNNANLKNLNWDTKVENFQCSRESINLTNW